ncbi:MAG TPA: cation:proton antiporter [Acidimicrobiales bacterium]|nr:cation:proton antiporter [Acidimicrobiales bacterium]
MTLNVSFVLAALALAAFICPLVGERLRVPGAVVEIVAGVVLSHFIVARDVASGSAVATLGGLGFMILMFLVGFELDLREIWGASRAPVVMGVVLFAVSLLASWLLVGHVAGASTIWVLAGAATSVGVTVPVLHVHGWMGDRFGRDVLMVGAVAEVVYLAALSVFGAGKQGSNLATVLVGLRGLGFLVFVLSVAALVRRLRSRVPRHFHRWFLRDDPLEVGLRGTFALLFGVVATAGFLRVPTVVGALLAGVIFRGVIGNAKAIIERVTSVGNSFFVPLFFLTVGLETPLRSDVVSLAPVVGAMLLALSVPRLVVAPFLRRRGYPWRLSIAGSVSLMAPLTLLVTTAEIGRATGLTGPRTSAALVIVAVVSAIIFPVLARILLPHRRDEELARAEEPEPVAAAS